MAVTTNGAAGAFSITTTTTGGVATTFNYNTPAGTDCLVFAYATQAPTSVTTPTGVTYNSVAMTQVSGSSSSYNFGGAPMETSFYYLLAPPTGSSLVMSATWSAAMPIVSMSLIPLIGVSQTIPVGTAAVSNAGTTGPTATVTAPSSGTANDLYLGICSDLNTTITLGGSQVSAVHTACRGSQELEVDKLPSSGSGAFSWTLASTTQWITSAVAFLATVAVIPPVPSRGPMPKQIYIMP